MFPIYLLQLQSTTQAQGAKPATTAPLDWCRGRTGDAEKMGNPLPGQGYNFRLLFTLFRNVVAVVLLVSVLPTDLLPHFLSHSSSILHYITIIILVLLLLPGRNRMNWPWYLLLVGLPSSLLIASPLEFVEDFLVHCNMDWGQKWRGWLFFVCRYCHWKYFLIFPSPTTPRPDME